jgi:hypothetical protein
MIWKAGEVRETLAFDPLAGGRTGLLSQVEVEAATASEGLGGGEPSRALVHFVVSVWF